MEDENREETIDQVFMSFENAEPDIPTYEESPNYYYDFVMDDEDPVEAVEKSISEYYNYDFVSKQKPTYENFLENIDDNFHNTLINNLICTKDIFNEQPTTDDDIHESLHNYILGRGKSLQNITENLIKNNNITTHSEYESTFSLIKQNAMYHDNKDIFIMDIAYNPKITDDFVCGSFVNAIKTPLTKMNNIQTKTQTNKMPQYTQFIGNTQMMPIITGHTIMLPAPMPTVGIASMPTNKTIMSFSKFMQNAASTINYDVIEFNNVIDFPSSVFEKNIIYSLRFKNIFREIDMNINAKIKYIEFDNCFHLRNLQICSPDCFPLRGITFNDTNFMYMSPRMLQNIFSPQLEVLIIKFSYSTTKYDWVISPHMITSSIFGERFECPKLLTAENDNNSKLMQINCFVTNTIVGCTGLKVLYLCGCNLVNYIGDSNLKNTTEKAPVTNGDFILPPNLREFLAINVVFQGKFVLPSTLFVLRLVDCVISREQLADSLEYLPETLYELHVENDFCVVEFLKNRKQHLPCALQKIYCSCCGNKRIRINGYLKSYGSHLNQIQQLSSFANLNKYCVGDLLHSARYPTLKYYLDMFYREPCAEMYKNIHLSELYCCVSNYLLKGKKLFKAKNSIYPTEYMRDDLRIIDIIKRAVAGRIRIYWALSTITVDTYDGKLPLDLIKYIAFMAYPYLGIDKFAKFDEYTNLFLCQDEVCDNVLSYRTYNDPKINDHIDDEFYQNGAEIPNFEIYSEAGDFRNFALSNDY